MSRKRPLIPDVYRTRKKICATKRADTPNQAWEEDHMNNGEVPKDTKAAFLYLRELFPCDKFEFRIPPIILKHQLYSIVKNRTQVDKELGALRSQGELRLFRLGTEANDFCVVLSEDYRSHVRKHTDAVQCNREVIDKFMDTIVSASQDISVDKQTLMVDNHFKDEEITHLVKAGVLNVRDVGSWWIAIPGAGLFMKSFIRGRKASLTMIRKCKYKEILKRELETRKLPKVAKLGMSYHICDIIGADYVNCIQTTSGELLRLKDTSG